MSRDERVWLADIVEACERITSYVAGMDEVAFQEDRKTFDAVVRNLEIIGEAVKQVPETTRSLAPAIEWKRIAGLRDVLIHAYFGIVQRRRPRDRCHHRDAVERLCLPRQAPASLRTRSA
jgi:uncharacterized protein with HEPN domain